MIVSAIPVKTTQVVWMVWMYLRVTVYQALQIPVVIQVSNPVKITITFTR